MIADYRQGWVVAGFSNNLTDISVLLRFIVLHQVAGVNDCFYFGIYLTSIENVGKGSGEIFIVTKDGNADFLLGSQRLYSGNGVIDIQHCDRRQRFTDFNAGEYDGRDNQYGYEKSFNRKLSVKFLTIQSLPADFKCLRKGRLG